MTVRRVAPTCKARLRYGAAVNLVCDGNSIMAGSNSSSTATNLAGLLAARLPGVTVTNRAIGGQSINNMRGINETTAGAPNPGGGDVPGGGVNDVDSSWNGAKTNVLLAWEISNSIYGAGWSGLQAVDQLRLYIAERKAVHPWKIVVATAVPRWATPYGRSNQAANEELKIANAYILANWRAMGIDAVADLRAGNSPFNIPTGTLQDFETLALWGTNGVNGMWSLEDNTNNADTTKHTHLQDRGFAYVATIVEPALRRVTA